MSVHMDDYFLALISLKRAAPVGCFQFGTGIQEENIPPCICMYQYLSVNFRSPVLTISQSIGANT